MHTDERSTCKGDNKLSLLLYHSETNARANSSPLLALVTVARGTGLSYDDANRNLNQFDDLPSFAAPITLF
jgi:hypothetical protein